MGKELFEQRKREFMKVITKHQRLPKPREYVFDDHEDMRLWFDKLPKIGQFQDFIDEVNKVLSEYNGLKSSINALDNISLFLPPTC